MKLPDKKYYCFGFGFNYFCLFGRNPISLTDLYIHFTDNLDKHILRHLNLPKNVYLIPIDKKGINYTSCINYEENINNTIAPLYLPIKFSSSINPFLSIGLKSTSLITLNKYNNLCQSGTINKMVFHYPISIPIYLPLPCIQISCGIRHTLALLSSGIVVSWGIGTFGQLGHGIDVYISETPRIIQNLLPPNIEGTVSDIAAGTMHSSVIIQNCNNNRVFSWGCNDMGQCGCNEKDIIIPYPLPLIPLRKNKTKLPVNIIKLSLGHQHSVALTSFDDGSEVYTWGSTNLCGHGVSKKKYLNLVV